MRRLKAHLILIKGRAGQEDIVIFIIYTLNIIVIFIIYTLNIIAFTFIKQIQLCINIQISPKAIIA